MSASPAPNAPPALRAMAPDALWDQPGSPRWYVARMRRRYAASATRISHFASRNRPASFAGRGAPEVFSATPISPILEWAILPHKQKPPPWRGFGVKAQAAIG